MEEIGRGCTKTLLRIFFEESEENYVKFER